MAQNEMKAKPALPERVRSMEGLGIACSPATEGCLQRAPKLFVIVGILEDVLLKMLNKRDGVGVLNVSGHTDLLSCQFIAERS